MSWFATIDENTLLSGVDDVEQVCEEPTLSPTLRPKPSPTKEKHGVDTVNDVGNDNAIKHQCPKHWLNYALVLIIKSISISAILLCGLYKNDLHFAMH